MKVQELLTRLSEVELANLDLGHSGEGCISDANLNKVIHALNGALTSLHKRYLIKIGSYILETTGTALEYQLAIPNFIKVLQAYSQTTNVQVPVNDTNYEYSVTANATGKVTVPEAGTYILSYQANYPLINKTNLNQELDVPEILIQAICYWVAYIIYGSMNTPENLNVSMTYLTKYNNALQEIDMQDSLSVSSIGANSKFNRNGWV